jgi:hypothetical protein
MRRTCHGLVIVTLLGQPALHGSKEPRSQLKISSAAASPTASELIACTIFPL